jgi:hypothetical protein
LVLVALDNQDGALVHGESPYRKSWGAPEYP